MVAARAANPALSDEQLRQARAMIAADEPKAAVARTLRVGRTTLYRYLDAPDRELRQAA